MQHMSSQELDRRINTFLERKHEEFPELKLRPQAPKQPKVTLVEALTELAAGFKWEFGR